MIKWILGILLVFLLIDHIWVHLGGPAVEKLRGQYEEDVKKSMKNAEDVPIQQLHRKSIIDELIEKAKSLVKKEEKEQK